VIERMRSGSRSHKMLALAVLACALALRLLVPEGWMPVSDAHGFRLTLCSGSGPIDMPMASMPGMAPDMAAHHDKPGHDQPAAEHSCPFANLGLALAEPVVPALTSPMTFAVEAIDPKPLSVTIGRGLAAPPPPSTGPPLPA
jgi:hypothetical protein